MIFFSSDTNFKDFYKQFSEEDLVIDLLVTESPKKQGRKMEIRPNPAHQFALQEGLEVKAYESLDNNALGEIKKFISKDKLGFIFAYGKIIPQNIISLFENGILNIHFSLLPDYPGASPIQQALLDNKLETGYSIFEITKRLDQGKLLSQEKVSILPEDNFDSLRSRIISIATPKLPSLIKRYLNWEIKLTKMPKVSAKLTHRITKEDGLISNRDSAVSAYNKIRAFSRWPKTYIVIDGRRFIINKAKLESDKLRILTIQPESRHPISFDEFKNGYQTLLTKMPQFVKID